MTISYFLYFVSWVY